jgi:hypothetical protein
MPRHFVAAVFRGIRFVLPGLVALTLSGPAHGKPRVAELTWNPSEFDFGEVSVGGASPKTFVLRNTAGKSSGEISISLSGSAAFQLTDDRCTGIALNKDKTCSVTVEYAPSTTTGDNGTLLATSPKSSASVTLSGVGGAVPTPNLVLSPGTLGEPTPDGVKRYTFAFGSVIGGTIATETFTISNTGTLTSESLALSIDPSQFMLDNDQCTTVPLAPGGSCTFDITYTAPAGCVDGTLYQATLQVDGATDGETVGYIDLLTEGECKPETCNVREQCVVFVTSTFQSGRLEGQSGAVGLAGADEICQARAAAGSLPGTYKAWLSDNTTDAKDRMTQAVVPYVDTAGFTVAASFAALLAGPLENPIQHDEHMQLTQEFLAWTGTAADGTRAPGSIGQGWCRDWTFGNIEIPPTERAVEGDPNATGPDWSMHDDENPCGLERHLYCFEQ